MRLIANVLNIAKALRTYFCAADDVRDLLNCQNLDCFIWAAPGQTLANSISSPFNVKIKS